MVNTGLCEGAKKLKLMALAYYVMKRCCADSSMQRQAFYIGCISYSSCSCRIKSIPTLGLPVAEIVKYMEQMFC